MFVRVCVFVCATSSVEMMKWTSLHDALQQQGQTDVRCDLLYVESFSSLELEMVLMQRLTDN